MVFSNSPKPDGIRAVGWDHRPLRYDRQSPSWQQSSRGHVAYDSDRSAGFLLILAHSCSSLLVLAGCCRLLPNLACSCRFLPVPKTICELAPAFRASRPLYSLFKYNCCNCRPLIEPLGHAIQPRIQPMYYNIVILLCTQQIWHKINIFINERLPTYSLLGTLGTPISRLALSVPPLSLCQLAFLEMPKDPIRRSAFPGRGSIVRRTVPPASRPGLQIFRPIRGEETTKTQRRHASANSNDASRPTTVRNIATR